MVLVGLGVIDELPEETENLVIGYVLRQLACLSFSASLSREILSGVAIKFLLNRAECGRLS